MAGVETPTSIKCSANQAVAIMAMKAPTVCMTITGFRNPLADIVSRAGLISDPLEAVDLRHCWPHEMQLCDRLLGLQGKVVLKRTLLMAHVAGATVQSESQQLASSSSFSPSSDYI